MHTTPSRPAPAQAATTALTRYRLAVAVRSLVAIFGGYALSAACAIWLGHLLPALGMTRLDAVLTASMLAFVVHACAAIWVFAIAGTWRAAIGILVPAAVLAVGAWAYGGAA
ncbi:iron transporter [Massilia aurea]|uniref:iron transporter n=1 Tax=Massilia aurea TaxID=373040 RepID=UPI00346305AD